jgi:hypothetical protein
LRLLLLIDLSAELAIYATYATSVIVQLILQQPAEVMKETE